MAGPGYDDDFRDEPPPRPAPLAAVEPEQFVRGDRFLDVEYPVPETLLGEGADRLLTRASFLLVYGDAGDGKSTFAVDGIAHLAAGQEWLRLPVTRPVRFCVVENEGAPALFQSKLRDKAEQWGAEADWLENLFVYAEPWGKFSFGEAKARAELREFCLAQQIDIVLANPLFGVGGPATGKPDETTVFVEWLKEIGLWQDIGFWLLHHVNKASGISGDWERHPDTLVRLERDGDAARTKLRWKKTRWGEAASEHRPERQLLEWITEHKGYKVADVDLTPRAVPDEELQARLDDYLHNSPKSTLAQVYGHVTGDDKRLRALLDDSARYLLEPGARGALLASLRADVPQLGNGELEWR